MADDRQEKPDRGFRPRADFTGQRRGARSLEVGPEGVFLHQNGKFETLSDPVDAFWAAVANDPREWNAQLRGYDHLAEHAAEATREDLRRALGWLEGALGLRARTAAAAACRYLAAMPLALLASDYGRILGIFNSRKVGMVWQVTPELDKRPLPRGPIPMFGREAGFGLIRAAPELYAKLAELGPELEEVVIGLVAEALRYGVSLPQEMVTRWGPSPSATG